MSRGRSPDSSAAAFAGAGLLTIAAPANAAQSAPSWEPDGNAAPPYGNLVFYDANGVPVYSGTNDLSNPFAYAVAITPADSGANKAITNFYNPQHGVLPANWSGTCRERDHDVQPASASADTRRPGR